MEIKRILIEGYNKHKNYLKGYFEREAIMAQKNHSYNLADFYGELLDAVGNAKEQVKKYDISLTHLHRYGGVGDLSFTDNRYNIWEIDEEYFEKLKCNILFEGAFDNLPNPDYVNIDDIIIGKNAILELIRENEISSPPEIKKTATQKPLKTRTDILKENIRKYGFFKLGKVIILSEQNQNELISKISKNKLPYAIAMFDYLGFINLLEKDYFIIKRKMEIEVSGWFAPSKDGRPARGNINSLSENTKEDKKRWTAHKHKETVNKDYHFLK